MSAPTDPLPVAILAGGLATRLRPITHTIPKALVPVAGEPFLTHQLRLLARHHLHDVVLCVGHLGEQIESAYGDGHAHGMRIRYSYDGPELCGTAGALRRALPLLGESFLTLYGDSYLDIDYTAVMRHFRESGAPALMTVIENTHGKEPSNVWFENHRILAYNKKRPVTQMHHIDYGLSAYRAEALAAFEGKDLSDLQSLLAEQGSLAGFEVTIPYHEIGSHTGLKALEDHFREQRSRH
jgi:NDP-sugar pyrophosphorylase family protein